MKTAKINVTRIDKSALFAGQNGKYLDLVFFENKGGPDQYGNTGFIVQDIGKDRRLAGERGPIIGNWKWDEDTPKPPVPPAGRYENAEAMAATVEGDDDIPF